MGSHWYTNGADKYFFVLVAVHVFVAREAYFDIIFGVGHWLRHPSWRTIRAGYALALCLVTLMILLWIFVESSFWPISIAYWLYRGFKEHKAKPRPEDEAIQQYRATLVK
jgi:hypothetical protein